ncbi:bifunctional 4-hydroxy-2-oxoglutarate aldolase/2-dehydro-3-deoxy-phosphogluconate aldolase [Gelidibacter salicanalis]|uniref:Bifunctional 4-hydroxy-2-oxoglutarate aldolase/2-dehydro-3-deoxy-phosphogluconate aldolase n=1 Tax=Gelidibacter salicanalis TaxID=291193 RepID=A0A934NDB1_9FLAO|nr:bifunctional 4-hydroxy-2-oxoglutarate aldolase/2-dehydro-3-deoxy-phosphogluconate aldolase [Gelidibacter salicanalis]MBJ7881535.1 bifunctional 4-hydroxy-2-oxoglutarate aldolase/2-dehydro-3-deoxy-phosphogluconate aldolase [Gelidibacter salicanalis]
MKSKTSFNWDLYKKAPIVGIVRNAPLETILKIAETYLEANLYTIEITMNTEGAINIIRVLRKEFPTLNVGAGTVCSKDDLNNALSAGAQFIVTPIINEEVIKSTVSQNIPIFPGAYTPTEIYKAWSLGASAVKVFPATQLGTQYLKDVMGPLNQIKLLPTGGVSIHNIKSFFEAGAIGVGMGSSLLNTKLIQNGDFIGLKNHFQSIKNEIKDYV